MKKICWAFLWTFLFKRTWYISKLQLKKTQFLNFQIRNYKLKSFWYFLTSLNCQSWSSVRPNCCNQKSRLSSEEHLTSISRSTTRGSLGPEDRFFSSWRSPAILTEFFLRRNWVSVIQYNWWNCWLSDAQMRGSRRAALLSLENGKAILVVTAHLVVGRWYAFLTTVVVKCANK
jgi:hypothetical protein